MSDKIKLEFKQGKLPEFLEKIDLLSKIGDTVKIKMDSENILIYSMMGKEVMLAFQNFLLKTSEFFSLKEDIDFTLDIIIIQTKKFVKNLKFVNNDETVFNITYKESADDHNLKVARSLSVVGGKLKINWLLGEHYEIRDIAKDTLNSRLDISNRKWYFTISRNDFDDIKKLSNINSERIINISINSGKVVLSETGSWEMFIGKTDEDRNSSLMLNKKFLSCINDEDDVTFNIFDSFMLIKDHESNLMLSFEQNFGDDE